MICTFRDVLLVAQQFKNLLYKCYLRGCIWREIAVGRYPWALIQICWYHTWRLTTNNFCSLLDVENYWINTGVWLNYWIVLGGEKWLHNNLFHLLFSEKTTQHHWYFCWTFTNMNRAFSRKKGRWMFSCIINLTAKVIYVLSAVALISVNTNPIS